MKTVKVSIVGKWLARDINSPDHVQKIPFCKCPGESPLKNTEKHLEESCNHPNL